MAEAMMNHDSLSSHWESLNQELLLLVAAYLPARDLLHFQCTSKELSELDTDSIWKLRCQKRWQPWPRYRLTERRQDTLEKEMPNSNWQQRYLATEKDATRTRLTTSDLQDLKWYLSFVLSGIRGEGRSEHMEIFFTPRDYLLVPGHPPLPYEIVQEPPPSSSHHIRSTLRGDRPFSERQWLRICDFPAHFVSRKESDAEWLIVNENVIMVSGPKS